MSKSEEGIATNILASRLQALEENGIIEKLEHPESKAKYFYSLTQKGIAGNMQGGAFALIMFLIEAFALFQISKK